MRARFAKDLIYTYTGSILLAVNPFQRLPIYGEDKMPVYLNKKLGAAEPHVYAMAEVAYATFLRTGSSQSLVVSGESGAGEAEPASLATSASVPAATPPLRAPRQARRKRTSS